MDTQGKRKASVRNLVDDLWDLLALNILYVFSCLPVFSFGAATAALYRVVADLKQKRCFDSVPLYYWQTMKENWKTPTALWGMVLFGAVVVFADFFLVLSMNSLLKYAYLGLLAFVAILLQILLTAGLPLSTMQTGSVKQLIQRSFFLFAAHPAKVLGACIAQSLPLVFALLAPGLFAALFLVWILGYFSLSSRITVLLLDQHLSSL